jgi:molybdate transport system permease protein
MGWVEAIDWTAVWLSIRLSVATAAILALIGMPIAYWLAFTRRRWRPLVEALVALPLVLPPTVLGFYLLVAMGPNGPLGALYEGATGRLLPFTFEGLLVASVLFSLPFAVQPFTVAFSSVDRALIEASWTLGRSRTATFVRIILPLSSGGVVAGLVLAFAHTLGEFGVVLMVGGNIAGQTRTISIAIYDRVQALDYTAAAATALSLLLISFTVLALTYGLRGSSLLLWPRRH